ncbi:MFS multidrug transporter [Lasiodiplodia theobromae]|uniref:MFS multidrug transporter n=1 Tax=Lasiodiplodia theobromae TaxID=45133 RepID=UPI0015C36BAC|nr:MFS multidrug transporter [Lasiodiplodia theobromae]KAF4540706.1 MFS multidrug transporter [Lasiodiplodia theobromae]
MTAPNNGDNDRELANVTPQADIEQDNVQHEERDVEKDAADANGSKSPAERNEAEIVDWEGPDDPENPKNWPIWRKWVTTLLTSLGGLVTLMSGAMMAPALSDISHELNIAPEEAQIALSIFILAFAFGPLFLGPCSEVFGRKPVWLVSSTCYVIWNVICGFATKRGTMMAARFFSGIGASAQFAISFPVLSDCWKPDQRGTSFALATFIPLLGPAIGPIVGGVITQSIGWRWLFWVLAIFNTFLIFLTTLFFRETHAATILNRKAKQLRRQTGRNYRTSSTTGGPTLPQRLKLALTRPYRLLLTQPILQLLSLLLAVNFGILYIVLSTYATMWQDRYALSPRAAGLHYIALVLGYTVAAQAGGPATDRVWAYLKTRRGGEAAPEYRVPLMVPGVLLLLAGLVVYGWGAQRGLHWAVVDVGIAVFGCGNILATQAMQAYVMDAFEGCTASASAASQFLRNVFAFAFPIFAPRMYERLGYGWGNTLLAGLFLALGVPGPAVLWVFGARIRGMGKAQR